MALLKDVHPFIAEVLDGKHDEILSAVEQAVAVRRKAAQRASGVVQDALVRVKGGRLDGREGTVVKVNRKLVSVQLDPLTEGDYEIDWRVNPAALEVLAEPGEAAKRYADEFLAREGVAKIEVVQFKPEMGEGQGPVYGDGRPVRAGRWLTRTQARRIASYLGARFEVV